MHYHVMTSLELFHCVYIVIKSDMEFLLSFLFSPIGDPSWNYPVENGDSTFSLSKLRVVLKGVLRPKKMN